jgi:phosphatidylinositol-3-phosphatase
VPCDRKKASRGPGRGNPPHRGGSEIRNPSVRLTFLLFLATLSFSCSYSPVVYAAPPAYDHIVIVVEENHPANQLTSCAYLNYLAAKGASFARMYAITHPSQPNYIALFSGSTQGITDDALHTITAANLYDSLLAAGRSFAGYSEGLPYIGFTDASSPDGRYVRKHAPWVSFGSVPTAVNLPFSSFPSNYSTLPTLSFVIPNLDNDMHDGTPTQADDWLATNMNAYAQWAITHNSLLIITFDEPYGSQDPATTPITTIFVGQGVVPGTVVPFPYTLYSLLAMIDEVYGLPPLGNDGTAAKIVGPWG